MERKISLGFVPEVIEDGSSFLKNELAKIVELHR